jgi:hypothetical protein
MKSEEKLSRLFESLKAEKTTTSIDDIASWIQSPSAVHSKVGKNGLMTKFIFIGIFTASIIGLTTMSFHKNNTPTTPPNLIKSDIPKVLDTITPTFKPVPLLRIKKTPFSLTPIVPMENESQMELLEIPDQFPPVILKDWNVAAQNDSLIIDSLHVRKWSSYNQGLQIDTVLQDIHTLIFKVDNCDIAVEGGSQSDVSIQYIDPIEKKLDQKTANEGYYQMNYQLQDSVLTIDCEMQSPYKKNLLKFIVPERLNVQVNTEFANIKVVRLNNVNTNLTTDYGDIEIENSSGIMKTSTEFGNINLKNIKGQINANTAFGEINGVNLNLNENSSFSADLGDVNVQINNSLKDCTLDLTSSMGIIRINRPELKKRGSGRINYGDGRVKVNMRSEMGKVVLK